MVIAADQDRLDRRWAVRELLRYRGDSLVVTGLGSPTYDVYAAGDHDANMYLWGAMGGAAMVGLGLALAQPQRTVIVFTGDGEMLMGLGSLATIAVQKPGNLVLAVLDNGRYCETGDQLSHSGRGVDLVAVAGTMGFAARRIGDAAALAEAAASLTAPGPAPRLLGIAISNAPLGRAMGPRDGVFLKNRVRRHLGVAGGLQGDD